MIFVCLLFGSCSTSDSLFPDLNNVDNLPEEKQKAYQVVMKAQEEFFQYVDDVTKKSIETNKDIGITNEKCEVIGGFDQTLEVKYNTYKTNIQIYFSNQVSVPITNIITNIIPILTNQPPIVIYAENDKNIISIITNITYTNLFIFTNYFKETIVSNEEISVSMLSPRETIINLAKLAYLSDDTNQFFEYLNNNGFTDKFWEIMDKYNIREQMDTLNIQTTHFQNTNEVTKSRSFASYEVFINYQWKMGDIFLVQGKVDSSGEDGFNSIAPTGGSIIGALIPGEWKHAGMIDIERLQRGKSPIIAAGPNARYNNETKVVLADGYNGYGTGYESVKSWIDCPDISAWRVKNATESQRYKSVTNAMKYLYKKFHFIEKAYSITKTGYRVDYTPIICIIRPWWGGIFTIPIPLWTVVSFSYSYSYFMPTKKTSLTTWYCAKIVYQAWKDTGFDIEYSKARSKDYNSADVGLFGLNLWAAYQLGKYGEGEVIGGNGDYEWVSPQNIADATNDGTIICLTNDRIILREIEAKKKKLEDEKIIRTSMNAIMNPIRINPIKIPPR